MDHDELKRVLDSHSTRIASMFDMLARVEQSTKRIEANHNEVRARIERLTRGIKMALPLVRKMIG